MVGHEVRNVLTTMTYALETVYSKVKPQFADRVRKTKTEIREQINLLVFLAHNDDIITNPDWQLDETSVGLQGDIIAPMVDMMRAFAGHKGITISYENFIRQGIPKFRLDKHRMDQVFYNLLSNAVKYAHYYSEIRIVYRGVLPLPGPTDQEPHLGYVFAVLDQGIGILEDEVERVFGLFERGSRASMQCFEGQGKGLTVAQQIMRKHGGEVWFGNVGGDETMTEVCLGIPIERALGRRTGNV